MTRRLVTSESVTEGHPDKIADQISDAVLDAVLEQDGAARVACEVLLTTGLVLVAGEMTTSATVDVPDVARETIRRIGYDRPGYGFSADDCSVLVALGRQSPDIARGVDPGGAGDQGMMFGYATSETPELMPASIVIAHDLVRRLAELRKSGALPWLRPDGKAQVTVEYEDGRPVGVRSVVVSTQHEPDIGLPELRREILERVIEPSMPAGWFDPATCRTHVNPTGRFVVGGPHGDTGLTGRKIMVDSYGGVARHGGGAFSGKDGTKVDRSAAYGARWAAKNVVAAGIAERCEVQLAYAIGVADPVSVAIDTFGTSVFPDSRIAEAVARVFDFTPGGLIRALGLTSPIFRPTAAYGHFGREPERKNRGGRQLDLFPWERTDRVDELRSILIT